MKLVNEAAKDYEEYRTEYEAMQTKKKKEEEQRQKADLGKISQDLGKEGLCSVRKAIRLALLCALVCYEPLVSVLMHLVCLFLVVVFIIVVNWVYYFT